MIAARWLLREEQMHCFCVENSKCMVAVVVVVRGGVVVVRGGVVVVVEMVVEGEVLRKVDC